MMTIINPNAAAGDIGSENIFVSLAGGSPEKFGTVTSELLRLKHHLLKNKVDTFAMEFTGVYWMPLYEILEQTRIKVCLVNGGHVKTLPGRKTDVADCMWLAKLHAHGLLKPGFVPGPEIRRLRDYVRLRDNHVRQAGSHLQQVQKAMELMNIKVHDVITDMAGVSGQRIIRAILTGERNTEVLIELCDEAIRKKKRQRLVESLNGTWAAQHLFAMRQAWESFQLCQQQMGECDREIETVLLEMAEAAKPQGLLIDPKDEKPKQAGKNAPKILNLHEILKKVLGGHNPTRIPGLGDATVLGLISEVGTDLSMFPTAKHFTSWLGLAPGSRNSGLRKRSHSRKGGRAGQFFRMVAQTVGRTVNSGLGAAYRRIRARRGGLVASKALGRKLAELYYRVMTQGMTFIEEGLAKAEKRYKEQQEQQLNRLARKMGYVLIPNAHNPDPSLP